MKRKNASGANAVKNSLLWRILVNWQLYLFMVPGLLYYFILEYWPIYGLQIAFKNYSPMKGIWGSPWVGFLHFERFFRSAYFAVTILNTLRLSLLSLSIGFILPIVFALMLNEMRCRPYKNFVQTVSYAPHFISVVVVVGILRLFVTPSTGIINHIIAALGGTRTAFMQEERWFAPLYIISGIWQELGWSSVIYMSALSGVDPALLEAATIDGANKIQRVWHVNLPVLKPTIVILLIMNCGQLMNVGYEKVLLMQTDTNLAASEIISTYVYKSGLINAEFSFSSAVSLFNSIINCILLITVNAVCGKLSETSLW